MTNKIKIEFDYVKEQEAEMKKIIKHMEMSS
jgi:hypothetical protein